MLSRSEINDAAAFLNRGNRYRVDPCTPDPDNPNWNWWLASYEVDGHGETVRRERGFRDHAHIVELARGLGWQKEVLG